MLGRPRVRLIHKQCSTCQQADALEAYYQSVPPGGNYAYDLIVEVGLARLRDHRQDAEIQRAIDQRPASVEDSAGAFVASQGLGSLEQKGETPVRNADRPPVLAS